MRKKLKDITEHIEKKKGKAIEKLQVVTAPGFKGVSVYNVLKSFFMGFTKGYLLDRGASVSFFVFLALFPAIMVVFTLISYLPLEDVHATIIDTITKMMPQSAAQTVTQTIDEIMLRHRGGLMSISMVLAFYFSSSAVRGLFRGFDMGVIHVGRLTFLKMQMYSVIATLIIAVLMLLSVLLIIIGQRILPWFLEYVGLYNKYAILMIHVARWLLVVFSLLVSVSILYYYGNPKRNGFVVWTPGSLLFTVMFIIGTMGFNFYISNFSNYNALYGSIGGIIIFLLWIYVNSVIVLIGYELNSSILVFLEDDNVVERKPVTQ